MIENVIFFVCCYIQSVNIIKNQLLVIFFVINIANVFQNSWHFVLFTFH